MQSATAVLVLLSLAIGSYADDDLMTDFSEVDSDDSRIIGGTIATTLVTYQVNLRNATLGYIGCSGAIIHPRWVCTSGTCAGMSHKFVVAGYNKLVPRGAVFNIAKAIRHPANNKFYNDIGLIKTATNMGYTPVLLPTANTITGVGVITGWGWTVAKNGKDSNDLMSLTANIITNEECAKRWYTMNITTTQVCTMAGVGKGICANDGGNPLVSGGRLVGVASWMATACAAGFPDGFTRVFSYLPWIRSTMVANP